MELYPTIINLINTYFGDYLISIIITLIGFKIIFNDRFENIKVLNFIRWFILINTLFGLIYIIQGFIFYPKEVVILNRATGTYAWAYWLMFVCANLIPLSLFSKKLSHKYLYVLLIVFLMRIGMYFERFVIITTSFHKDYAPNSLSDNLFLDLVLNLISSFLYGLIITLLLLSVFEVKKRFKKS